MSYDITNNDIGTTEMVNIIATDVASIMEDMVDIEQLLSTNDWPSTNSGAHSSMEIPLTVKLIS